ncbi:MFS transporter [Microlunatus endophyticus]|uniref:MFS transporter n=1 Tax=Microlunatus endophyticus TaxID=1716077 RepID=A0A917VZH2_9ACTN|nr:MFS transporter [Microlunatus endophyticus]GGL49038.1 MFS transporter [Microlunatus endophyticus]
MSSLITRVAGPLRRLRQHDESDFDYRLIAPMILGAMLNPINSSIIAVSLVPIGIAFGAPPAETTWLVSSLYLATSIGQPVVGKLVDSFGPRRLFLIGTALVGIAGVMGLFAPNLGVLIAARVVLGLGTCAGYPTSMYLIRSEGRRTGRDSPQIVLTILSMATQTVLAIGPTLGGVLMSAGGWRATFAVNIPLSVAALILGVLRIPKHTALQEEHQHRRPPRIDLTGIGLFAAMIIALMLFLIDISSRLWYLPVIAILAGGGFALRELRTGDPFIDLRVLRGNAPLMASYLRALLAATVSYAMIYGFTQWLEDGRGLTPTISGIVLLPLFVAGIAAAAVVGRRKEIRGKLVVAAVALLIACVLILFVRSDAPIWVLMVITGVAGVNNGLTSLANQNAVYYQAEPERIAASAGLLRTFSYLGSMAASAGQGALLRPTASTPAMHQLAIFMLIFAGLFLIMSLADRSLSRVTTAS